MPKTANADHADWLKKALHQKCSGAKNSLMQNIQALFVSRGVDRTALAVALGITNSAVWQWREVPPTRVLDVERVTGIHRSELRPDLYPVETAQ